MAICCINFSLTIVLDFRTITDFPLSYAQLKASFIIEISSSPPIRFRHQRWQPVLIIDKEFQSCYIPPTGTMNSDQGNYCLSSVFIIVIFSKLIREHQSFGRCSKTFVLSVIIQSNNNVCIV